MRASGGGGTAADWPVWRVESDDRKGKEEPLAVSPSLGKKGHETFTSQFSARGAKRRNTCLRRRERKRKTGKEREKREREEEMKRVEGLLVDMER